MLFIWLQSISTIWNVCLAWLFFGSFYWLLLLLPTLRLFAFIAYFFLWVYFCFVACCFVEICIYVRVGVTETLASSHRAGRNIIYPPGNTYTLMCDCGCVLCPIIFSCVHVRRTFVFVCWKLCIFLALSLVLFSLIEFEGHLLAIPSSKWMSRTFTSTRICECWLFGWLGG